GSLAQRMWFHRRAKHLGPDRIATLDSETLTREPASCVAKAAAHFGLRQLDSAAYADHPAISRNSKSGETFQRGERQMDQVRAREDYGDEIEKVAEWVRVVGEQRGISFDLPFSL